MLFNLFCAQEFQSPARRPSIRGSEEEEQSRYQVTLHQRLAAYKEWSAPSFFNPLRRLVFGKI